MCGNTVHCIMSKINIGEEGGAGGEFILKCILYPPMNHVKTARKYDPSSTLEWGLRPDGTSSFWWSVSAPSCLTDNDEGENRQGGEVVHKKWSKGVEINQPQGFLFLCLPLGVCKWLTVCQPVQRVPTYCPTPPATMIGREDVVNGRWMNEEGFPILYAKVTWLIWLSLGIW